MPGTLWALGMLILSNNLAQSEIYLDNYSDVTLQLRIILNVAKSADYCLD